MSPPAAHRKRFGTRVRATEGPVFDYRPPSATKRMMNGDEPEDDLITDDDALDETPTYPGARTMRITIGEVRRVIREEATNAFAEGLKPINVDVLKKKWPKFHEHLQAKFGDALAGAKVAVKKTGVFSGDPYVMLPDKTVVFWSGAADKFAYSSSETVLRALARL